MPNPHSTAQVSGHPIHPMLVPFPIAFFTATLACDIAFWATGDGGWAAATRWLLGAGIIIALLAAVAGFTDVVGDRAIRSIRAAWLHLGGNLILVAIEIANLIWRLMSGDTVIVPGGFVLSLVAVLLMLFTGWKGWEMVYRDHVGIAET